MAEGKGKKEKIYPKNFPVQSDKFSDRIDFKNEAFKTIREVALETTRKAFKDKGFEEKEGKAGVYGNGLTYGKGIENGKFTVHLSSGAAGQISHFEKYVALGAYRLTSEVKIVYNADTKNVTIEYKTDDSFGSYQNYGDTKSPNQFVNDKESFNVKGMPAFKKELAEKFLVFAKKEVAYLSKTNSDVSLKKELAENRINPSFSINDLINCSPSEMLDKMRGKKIIKEEKIEKVEDQSELELRMDSLQTMGALNPDKLKINNEIEVGNYEIEDQPNNLIKQLKNNKVNIAGLSHEDKRAYMEELQREKTKLYDRLAGRKSLNELYVGPGGELEGDRKELAKPAREFAENLLNNEFERFDHAPMDYIRGLGWDVREYKNAEYLKGMLTPTEEDVNVLTEIIINLKEQGIEPIDIAENGDVNEYVSDLVADKINAEMSGGKKKVDEEMSIDADGDLRDSSKNEVWKELDFNDLHEYFDYIADSLTNGNRSQVKELWNNLNSGQKREFMPYAREMGFNEIINYITDNLISEEQLDEISAAGAGGSGAGAYSTPFAFKKGGDLDLKENKIFNKSMINEDMSIDHRGGLQDTESNSRVGNVSAAIPDIKSIERSVDFSIRGNSHEFPDNRETDKMVEDYTTFLSDKELFKKYESKFFGNHPAEEMFSDDDFEENGNYDELRVSESYYITFKDGSEIMLDFSIPGYDMYSAEIRNEQDGSMANKYIGEFQKSGWNMDIDELKNAIGSNHPVTEARMETQAEKNMREAFERTPYGQRLMNKKLNEGANDGYTRVELNPGSGYVPKGMEHNHVLGDFKGLSVKDFDKKTDKDFFGKSYKKVPFTEVKKDKKQLNETGEWNNNDANNIAWMDQLKTEIQNIVDDMDVPTSFEFKDVRGFDTYQGPYANVTIFGKPYQIWTMDNGELWIENYPVDNTSAEGKKPGFQGTAFEIADMINREGARQSTLNENTIMENNKRFIVLNEDAEKGINKFKTKMTSLAENAKTGDNKRYIITEKKTDEEKANRWEQLAGFKGTLFESYNSFIPSKKPVETKEGIPGIISENMDHLEPNSMDALFNHDTYGDSAEGDGRTGMGEENDTRDFENRVPAEAGDMIDGMRVIIVAKPNSLSNAKFKVFEDDFLNESLAFIQDLNSGNMVNNPNYKTNFEGGKFFKKK